MKVRDGENYRSVLGRPVDNGVWKALKDDLPYAVSILQGPSVRVFADQDDRAFDVIEKSLT